MMTNNKKKKKKIKGIPKTNIDLLKTDSIGKFIRKIPNTNITILNSRLF